jgi:hypothetical protein
MSVCHFGLLGLLSIRNERDITLFIYLSGITSWKDAFLKYSNRGSHTYSADIHTPPAPDSLLYHWAKAIFLYG